MSEGTAKENAESQVKTRVFGDKVDEYGLKAARRAPQFSRRSIHQLLRYNAVERTRFNV